ncbi:TPA: hypothetical protein TUI13_000991 [Streptococcus equi subsp. zooepidemicus]|nr:hypothetical protein [Streptococcus equi subsp. zooepidemicus]HEL0174660.1 hypothetical protein [Streptococcus equi subsp. zooepidemicus]HEL0188807.1 hypothetical protein [Streptococcus equi subsp. zooepidemicus]HEL0214741.1 hypothetical protein [Streptococcus equi subsp. zooepidemicus]HEL0252269.1 hypothetical protein [Streptococcus equi subsp. zooepidemicus]
MKKEILSVTLLTVAVLSLSTRFIYSTDYSDLNHKEMARLIQSRKQPVIKYHDNVTINKMITYLAQAKREGILTETFLMNYIFAGEGEYLTKNSRIIADPDGGYWSILEGYEGDGGVKTGIDGVSELNIFSPESTSIGELQEAVLAWYEANK